MIPAMTTGMRDYCCRWVRYNMSLPPFFFAWVLHTPWWRGKGTFMIRSGLNTPTPAMPMPDFAVPYAAPAPVCGGW